MSGNHKKPHESQVSFGRIIDLGEGLYEIITWPNIEITAGHIEEIMDFLSTHSSVKQPGILINRKNSYYYSFSAMQKFGTLNWIKAIAVLAENRKSYIRSKTVVESFTSITPQEDKLRIFRKRDEALKWLRERTNSFTSS